MRSSENEADPYGGLCPDEERVHYLCGRRIDLFASGQGG